MYFDFNIDEEANEISDFYDENQIILEAQIK
jgi:hypothetical protein